MLYHATAQIKMNIQALNFNLLNLLIKKVKMLYFNFNLKILTENWGVHLEPCPAFTTKLSVKIVLDFQKQPP